MKRIFLTTFFSATLLFAGCKNENQNNEEPLEDNTELTEDQNANTEEEEQPQEITVQLQPKSGSEVSGTVTFSEENGEVTMTADISGLPEGQHAIHLHETGDCSAEDAKSAGGHWNPTGEDHGEWGSQSGYHRGDIGNFDVNADGQGSITFTTDQWCIGCDDEQKNIVGKAVVIHDGVDDYTSQPSGAAGTRVACGVISQ